MKEGVGYLYRHNYLKAGEKEKKSLEGIGEERRKDHGVEDMNGDRGNTYEKSGLESVTKFLTQTEQAGNSRSVCQSIGRSVN